MFYIAEMGFGEGGGTINNIIISCLIPCCPFAQVSVCLKARRSQLAVYYYGRVSCEVHPDTLGYFIVFCIMCLQAVLDSAYLVFSFVKQSTGTVSLIQGRDQMINHLFLLWMGQ